MCGRTCLTLNRNEIQCCCKYKKITEGYKADDTDSWITPNWRSEFNLGKVYEPSYNIPPTSVTPVIVSSDHFGGEDDDNKTSVGNRVIVPMMWGMIPFWHKGDYRKHRATTNNCRLEHMLESKMFQGPFSRGQRCVILCEGFYEWQTTQSSKPSERPVYFLYTPQSNGIKIQDKATWECDSSSTINDHTKVKLLKLAGIFDIWVDDKGDKIYSYSVITFKASQLMSWLHYRMPAILETEEQMNKWIDFKNVSNEEALKVLVPASQLSWHQVSNLVNNSRQKSDKCNKPISETTTNRKIKSFWSSARKRKEEQIKKDLPLSEDEVDEEIDDVEDDSDDFDFSLKRPRDVCLNSDSEKSDVEEKTQIKKMK